MICVDSALRCVSLAADTRVSDHATDQILGGVWLGGGGGVGGPGSQETGLRQCGQLSGR